MNFVNRRIEAKLDSELPAREFDQMTSDGRKWPIRYDYVETMTIVLDIATITIASVFANALYQSDQGISSGLGQSLGSAALVSALFMLFLKSQGLYRPTELLMLRRQIQMVCAAWAGVVLLLCGIVFAMKIGSVLSRGTSILFVGLSLVALIANRSIVRHLLAKGLADRRFSGRNVVLIAEPGHAFESGLSETMAAVGFEVMGSFALPPPGASPGLQRRLMARVVEYVRGSDVEEIIVSADPNRWQELRTLAAELRVVPFPITFVPVGSAAEIFRRPHRDLGKAVCVELQRGTLTAVEHAAKRCIDLIGASVALALLSPLLVMVYLLIKLDSPGPALFKQQRRGFNGRIFEICKFRTMTVCEDGFSAVQARAADDRITRIGKWLRRTSIDELPQLINVLEGSMSLVGPRPHAVAHDNQFDKVVRNYAYRRCVRPGLTGWAQVHGCRGPTPTTDLVERRVDYDLWYIDNWSLRLDIAILLQTPIEVLRGRNAY